MRSTILWEVVTFGWLLVPVFKCILGEPANFEIVPSSLIYYNSDSDKGKISFTEGFPVPFNNKEGENGPLNLPASSQGAHNHQQHKHYRKGSVRKNHERKDSDTERNARRQGQQCKGVCRYIPDRDFCPTDIVEEYEAYDDEYSDEEDYSGENSIEDSDEYYDEDEYYDDEDNEVRRTKPRPRLTSSKARNSTLKPVYGPPINAQFGQGQGGANSNLHVVYPSLTRFAATKYSTKSSGATGVVNGTKKAPSKRSGVASMKSRQRQRRLKHRHRQPSRPVKLSRAPALEQEIIIRWDRAVERGPHIGGDIVLPEGVLLRPPNFRFQRKRWTDGVIPFTMDPSLNSCRQNAIFDAMDEIESKTCIRFVERDAHRNYIDIRRAQLGCSSYVGMIGGSQNLNLSTGCFSKFTVTHELIHAIGFDHEQSRKDRNKYIEVDFDNVLKEKEGQFELNPTFAASGFPYDIRSIMHYSAFLFAKDKCEPTIYPVNEKIDICDLGAGNGKGGMTNCDAAKINKMYKCGKKYPQKCKV